MKKKILFLRLHLKVGGGSEKVISMWANELSEKYDIYILTFYHYKDLYSFKGKYYSLKENLIKFNKILRISRFFTYIRPFRIYKLIKHISPDYIVSFGAYPNIFAILTKILFRIKVPLLISIRQNPKMHYELKEYKFLIKILYRMNSVDKIIVPSREIQFILQRDYRIQRLKSMVIHNGIDIEKIKELKEEPLLNMHEIFNNSQLIKFIIIGRLVELKGHKILIEAFSKCKREIPSSKLLIIGDGPIKNELKNFTKKLNLTNDIIFLGVKKNPFNYLAKSDIFVLSSLSEGFPNVLLEALACGLPVISTDCETGPKEILDQGQYGILVKVMDSEDLANKMMYLAKNSDLQKEYSKLSLERAKFFNSKKILNQWIELFE